jgi:hypothetical protein
MICNTNEKSSVLVTVEYSRKGGTLLGMTGALRKNEGAVEKLARLRAACGVSGWLKLGAALGAKGVGACLRGGGE